MNGEDKAKAASAEEASRAEPGLGTALLAVVAIVSIAVILSALIYLLMVAIRPIESRQPKSGLNDSLPAQSQNMTPLLQRMG